MINDELIPGEVLENVRKARALDRNGWMLLVRKMSSFHQGLLREARKQGEEQRANMLAIGIRQEWQGKSLNEIVLEEKFLGGTYWMTVYCLPDDVLDFVISLLNEVTALCETRQLPHAH